MGWAEPGFRGEMGLPQSNGLANAGPPGDLCLLQANGLANAKPPGDQSPRLKKPKPAEAG
jgi:hypothetical protein